MSNSISLNYKNYLEQLGHLRALTVRMNIIHEAQALQVRNYPLLIPGVKSAVTEIDIETKTVVYKLTPQNKKFNLSSPKVKKICDNIKIYIQEVILWPNTNVFFTVSDSGAKNVKSNRKKRSRR
jgi:hypothetical protein